MELFFCIEDLVLIKPGCKNRFRDIEVVEDPTTCPIFNQHPEYFDWL